MMDSARPLSGGVSADTDVNLDFLTKEEREALLSKKMDMIRQRNKALSERHQMIEADKKKAEEAGNAVKSNDSKTLPAEGAPKGRGRGRGQSHPRDSTKPARERPKSSGDFRDSSNYEPIVDTSDLANYRTNRGRGHFDHREGGSSNTPKNKRRTGPREEGGHRSNSHRQEDGRPDRGGRRKDGGLNRPLSEDHHAKEYDGRLKGNDGPPPDPSFNPLADRRRSEKKEETTNQDSRRHPRNYGGGADLSKIKQSMRTMRDKERERPTPNKSLDMVMTGKERRNHEEWKKERERVDKERIQRQMDDTGGWRRAWDMEKLNQEVEDLSYLSPRLEPAKRPAGRIGSGRFDRGERDDRPRSAVLGSKGGLQHPGNSAPSQQQQQPHQPHHQQQHQLQQQQQMPMSPQLGGGSAPGGKGRGRGRGRGRGGRAPGGSGQGDHGGGASANKNANRPRTWSGGEDSRLVECQKEMLLVKFDNTAGDNSVEVEYDNKLPSPVKSTPGRGPTGRTPNQSPNKTRREGGGGKAKNRKHRGSRHEGEDHLPQASAGATAERVRTSSSHSHSHGDSEEWEDCTESSGHPEEDPSLAEGNLYLECKLNPEAPEFLPTSPDFLKTPPGHVKVLNWAADGGSSQSSPNLSQASLTSPRLSTGSTAAAGPTVTSPPSQTPATPSAACAASPLSPRGGNSSSTSSPGSSASVKAARRRAMMLEEMEEDMDAMPEGDDPHPPPFLLEAGGLPAAGQEEEEEFEDVPETVEEAKVKETGNSKTNASEAASPAALTTSNIPSSSNAPAKSEEGKSIPPNDFEKVNGLADHPPSESKKDVTNSADKTESKPESPKAESTTCADKSLDSAQTDTGKQASQAEENESAVKESAQKEKDECTVSTEKASTEESSDKTSVCEATTAKDGQSDKAEESSAQEEAKAEETAISCEKTPEETDAEQSTSSAANNEAVEAKPKEESHPETNPTVPETKETVEGSG